jgi:glycosyltransferase involved in cell wall biosynthesis
MSDFRTVAVIAGTAFPPFANANVHRVLAWTRYLPSKGWRVVVFTLPKTYLRREQLDHSLLNRIPTGTIVRRVTPWLLKQMPRIQSGDLNGGRPSPDVSERAWNLTRRLTRPILLPDTRILWVPPAFHAVQRFHRMHGLHALISTSRENSSHVLGWLASSRLRLPWIADFQDPWRFQWQPSQNVFSERALELMARAILRSCSLATVVSWSLRSHLMREYGLDPSKVLVLTNGFEPKNPPENPEGRQVSKRERFLIVHTGSFYGRRTPEVFLLAVKRFLGRNPSLRNEIEVRLIGEIQRDIATRLGSLLQAQWLRVLPRVPHAEALQEQSRADLLLLIPGEDAISLPGKVFEYLAAGPPILTMTNPGSDTARLLNEAGGGFIVPPDDPNQAASILEKLIGPDKPTHIPAQKSNDYVMQYSWEAVGMKTALLLNRLSSAAPGG